MIKPVDSRSKALEGLGDLPPFSPVLNRLLASLASEDVSFGEISDLIEKDTVLAGNILRLVNSALHGRRGTISSVRHAVSLMGIVRLRNTVMTMSVARIWSKTRTPKGWSASRFNLHSVAVAVYSDILAQKAQVIYPEGAFVAGLLHDVGLLLLAVAYREEFGALRRMHLEKGYPVPDCEREIFGADHADISAAALHQWNLPEPIRQAVRYQFQPEHRSSEEYPLSWVLHAAHDLTDSSGLTLFGTPAPPDTDAAGCLESLEIEHTREELNEEFQCEFEPIKAFF